MTRAMAQAAGKAIVLSTVVASLASGQTASVSGVVFDSIGRSHLAHATVALVGVASGAEGRRYGARTDSAGRFAIAGIVGGRYLATFYHAALDTLGIILAERTMDFGGGAHRLMLASPSPETVLRTLCPSRAANDSSGLLLGHVRSTDSDMPIEGASVEVEWTETTIEGASISSTPRRAQLETRDAGAFALCSVPHGFTLLTRAAHGNDTSGYAGVEVPAYGVRHVTLVVGGAVRAVAGDGVGLWRGSATLRGEVSDGQGRPVGNAQVSVWGTGRTARSNDRGAFRLDALPGGTQTVAVKALGYGPQEKVVHLAPARAATVRFDFVERAVTLSGVTVRSGLVYSRGLAQFERNRMRAFGGHFLLPRDIEMRTASTSLGTLLQGIAGVEVIRSREGTSILMRAAATYVRDGVGYCSPTLYIDGRRTMLSPTDAESFYVAGDLAAVEVYARPTERPMEYQDFNKCGAIVLWTRPPQPKVGPER